MEGLGLPRPSINIFDVDDDDNVLNNLFGQQQETSPQQQQETPQSPQQEQEQQQQQQQDQPQQPQDQQQQQEGLTFPQICRLHGIAVDERSMNYGNDFVECMFDVEPSMIDETNWSDYVDSDSDF
jgi:FtsZ-interacting cell division protein YlmF